MIKKIYFAPHPHNGTYIAITHNETGYSPTTVYNQAHADELNKRQGNTPEMVESAVLCSMFDLWDRFETMVEAA